MILVLIVDDHKIVVEGLQLLLDSIPDVKFVGSAQQGIEAIERLKELEVDVVLMDINMPEMNGIEACKRIKKLNTEVSIIALTMVDDISMIRKMVKAGADGYLMKNAGKEELENAIKTVHSGDHFYGKEVSDTIFTALSGNSTPKSSFPRISRREKEILGLIINEMTTSEIAQKLHISFGTVETHRRNIMNKLGARNTAGMVRIALENILL
jgi:DNA-binding NarL/FixJ family response regulator